LLAAERGGDIDDRGQAVVDLGNTLVDARRRPRVQRVDVMSCAAGADDRGRRAIDALARIWRVRVRGLLGDFVATAWLGDGITGWVQIGDAPPMYGLEYRDRWPDDPRLFYASSAWRR
jgi:hypothetical protein